MKELVKQAVRKTGLRRQHVAGVRMCCERNLLARVGRIKPRDVGRILCYHSIGQPAWGVNDVSPASFRRHIETALEAGLRFVPASRIALSGGDARDVAITFDDGLRSVAEHAAPILAEYAVPWSLFIVSDWSETDATLGEDTVLKWRDIERLLGPGVELGSHSVTHPDFRHLDSSRIVDELGTSRAIISQRLGITPNSFAIPFGQSANWPEVAARSAREVGYDLVYAQAEDTRPSGTIARTFVTRFDGDRIFSALLAGAFDRWEEWY